MGNLKRQQCFDASGKSEGVPSCVWGEVLNNELDEMFVGIYICLVRHSDGYRLVGSKGRQGDGFIVLQTYLAGGRGLSITNGGLGIGQCRDGEQRDALRCRQESQARLFHLVPSARNIHNKRAGLTQCHLGRWLDSSFQSLWMRVDTENPFSAFMQEVVQEDQLSCFQMHLFKHIGP